MNDEYFVMERENNDNHPLFSWDQKSDGFGMGKPVQHPQPVRLRLGQPIPPSPEWVDFHEAPEPVVSKVIADRLRPMDIYGVQWVPAQVAENPLPEAHEYWFIHIWNRIACLDRNLSQIRTNRSGTRIFSIERLVLDEGVLGAFELRKRLVFELAEKSSIVLVHGSIKDAILQCKPVGVRFFPVQDWSSSVGFR